MSQVLFTFVVMKFVLSEIILLEIAFSINIKFTIVSPSNCVCLYFSFFNFICQ